MTRITDMCGDLQADSSVWLFKSPLAGGGGILWQPHYRLQLVLSELQGKVEGKVCHTSTGV